MSSDARDTSYTHPRPVPTSTRWGAYMKRLVLFLDGTWNDPEDNTNVWRLKLMTARRDDHGIEQMLYYNPGLGTGSMLDKHVTATFGIGLNDHIRSAYQWLMEHYEDGDPVFIFGFSRGAFTARSLAGLIARCGLLRPTSPFSVGQIFERYRAWRSTNSLHTIEEKMKQGRSHELTRDDMRLLAHTRHIDIEFIGVFDTVGALGVPGIGTKRHQFHSTQPSPTYKHFFQALAVDEQRRWYRPALWTCTVPEDAADPMGEMLQRMPGEVEQRWFVGSHTNVGGGDRSNTLASIPLRWMQEMAHGCGLAFRDVLVVEPDAHLAPILDSYRTFLHGSYALATLGRRYHRVIGASPCPNGRGICHTLNETVDETVFRRMEQMASYRPVNVIRWQEQQED